jgi:hypothetical protein
VWVCVCVDFVMCGCVYVWILLCVGVCMCGWSGYTCTCIYCVLYCFVYVYHLFSETSDVLYVFGFITPSWFSKSIIFTSQGFSKRRLSTPGLINGETLLSFRVGQNFVTVLTFWRRNFFLNVSTPCI